MEVLLVANWRVHSGAMGRARLSRTATRVHAIRVLDGGAPCDTSAAVVTDDRKALEPESPRMTSISIERHGALRVVGVILAVGRLAAVAVAAQVGHDHGEALGEARRNLVPLACVWG